MLFMSSDRIKPVIDALTLNTVLGDLVEPIARALQKVRYKERIFFGINMLDFITLGVHRHLQANRSLREMVQQLMHFGEADWPPVARSTFSDALASVPRRGVLRGVTSPLIALARERLPDRLADLDIDKERAVLAMDGTYQHESAHFRKSTPRNGGEDNPKGHALLTFYDVRLGCPCDVQMDTRNRHETTLLKDYDSNPDALTHQKNALWLVDRAFIDAKFWEAKKKKHKITMITRMKSSLIINQRDDLPVADIDCNAGVVTDQMVELNSTKHFWRLITYQTPSGKTVQFLTNEHELEPGVIAFLYSRRWDEEKCFDTWKNDLAMGKAWGKSPVAIENQVRLAIIASILLAMFIQDKAGKHGVDDEKSLRKQHRRQTQSKEGTDRPGWTIPLFRYCSKVSRQIIRFLKFSFDKQASHDLYSRLLWPLMRQYL
jgi:hypothetical protein